MAKIEALSDVGSLANTTAARAVMNDNSQRIEDALQNTLSRDGSAPNQMGADIDLDSHYLLNVADAVSEGDAVNLRVARNLAADAGSGDTALRFDLNTSLGAALVKYRQPFTDAVDRTLESKVREVVSIKDFGAVMDNVTDDYAAINKAVHSGAKCILIPTGTAYSSFTFTLPAGVAIKGQGASSTIRFPQGVNGFNMSGGFNSIEDLTLDGTLMDDVIGGSGVILYSDGFLKNVVCNHFGFHGFATPELIGAHRNTLLGCRALDTGHRGINMSNGSTYNRVTNFQARDCKRAGIILGYKSNYNVFSDIFIDGYSVSEGGAGLWVHMNSDYNVFTNVVVGPQDGTGTTAPSVILAAGCQGNTFNNLKLRGVGTRGILLWNLAVDHPELGTADAPLQENRFIDVDILGTAAALSAGIVMQSDDSLYVENNQFDRIYINGFVDGIYDNDTLSAGCEFRNVRFGASITGRKMRVGSSADRYRTGKRINMTGLTGIGSLASAMTEYDVQPAIPASGVPVTQPYPFPVQIFLAGMAGTTGVQINGVNVNSALHDLGNGMYTLLPGQTITLVYTSGTPNWRWFGL